MQSVIEEECTRQWRAGRRCWRCRRTDAVIIPEPGPGMAALYTAEVGVVWAWVTVTGRPAHVRDMQAGLNAIEAAMRIAARFKDYEREMNRGERIHPAFRGVNHPVNVNLGTIEGGEWNSSRRHPLPHRPAGRRDAGLHRGADPSRHRAASSREAAARCRAARRGR